MSGFLENIRNLVSPSKPKPVNGDQPAAEEPRGLKRKADPYDDVEADEDESSAANARTQLPSGTPTSSLKDRLSATKAQHKRRSRSTSRPGDIGPTKDFPQSNDKQTEDETLKGTRSKAPVASMTPLADMGGPGIFGTQGRNSAAGTSEETVLDKASETFKSATSAIVSKAKQTFGSTEGNTKTTKTPTKATVNTEDDGEELEVEALLKHRVQPDGRIELLVKWANEPEEAATYEPEEEIQENAAETLFAYWKKLGGREHELFEKKDASGKVAYHVYKILRHEKKDRGGFQFLVQWVGYPATAAHTTMEPEAKLKQIAPDHLEDYWESKGGREKFLAKRGKAKKPRTK